MLGTRLFVRLVEENGEFFVCQQKERKEKRSLPLFHISKSIQKQDNLNNNDNFLLISLNPGDIS